MLPDELSELAVEAVDAEELTDEAVLALDCVDAD